MARQGSGIYPNYQIPTEILARSIRHPNHVVEAALFGADVATLSRDVLRKLLQHPHTDRGLEQFLAEWNTLSARPKARVCLTLCRSASAMPPQPCRRCGERGAASDFGAGCGSP